MNPLARQLRTRFHTTTLNQFRGQSTSAIDAPEKPEWPTILSCPAPKCSCVATPQGLNIKRDGPMALPPHTRHVVIRTGRSDWASRIEDEEASVLGDVQEKRSRGNLAKALKALLGPGGKYHDPTRNVLVTNGSSASVYDAANINGVFVFPQGIYVPKIYNTPEDHDLFVREFLISRSERQKIEAKRREVEKKALSEQTTSAGNNSLDTSDPSVMQPSLQMVSQSRAVRVQRHSYKKVDRPTILVCTHNSRDSRCGILGPLVEQSFKKYLTWRQIITPAPNPPTGDSVSLSGSKIWKYRFDTKDPYGEINVASISHVGGHAWAGNVIVYIPWDYRLQNGEQSPLAGKGIWYGRVEPKHVEGIVEETIRRGNIIEELLRGVKEQKLKRRLSGPTRLEEVFKDGLLESGALEKRLEGKVPSKRRKTPMTKEEMRRLFVSKIY